MPNFLVGYEDKNEFLIDKINEYAPISLDDFVDMLHDDYGHYKPTMFAYIGQYLSEYLNGNVLETATFLIDNDIRDKLANNLHDDIYSTKYIKELFVEYGIDISKNVFTRTKFDSIGYCFRKGNIIKKEFNSKTKQYVFKEEPKELAVIYKDDSIKTDIEAMFNDIIEYSN